MRRRDRAVLAVLVFYGWLPISTSTRLYMGSGEFRYRSSSAPFFRSIGTNDAVIPSFVSADSKTFAAALLCSGGSGITSTPRAIGSPVPGIVGAKPLITHLADSNMDSIWVAKAAASGLLSKVTVTYCPARLDIPAWMRSCCSREILLGASLASSCTLANRSCSARSLAWAVSLANRAISTRKASLSDCWSFWSLRLFHQCRIPKIDSPATPMTTITPNINSQTSMRASNASSSVLSIDDADLPAYAAVGLVVIGLVSLVLPTLALLRILERKKKL